MPTIKSQFMWNVLRLRVFSVVFFVILSSLPLVRMRTAAQKGAPVASPEAVFSNPAPITINTAAAAATAPVPWSPYPSTITASGMSGNITKLTVSVYGLNDPRDTNFDILLVGPTGANFILASDMGNVGGSPQDLFFTFDDAGPTLTSNLALVQGVYKPFNSGSGDTFPAPAPAGPYNSPAPSGSATLASIFNGTDPNGDWKLYIVDDEVTSPAGSAGYLANGWALNVTTSGTGATTFANGNAITFNDHVAAASLYPSPITVSGMSGVISTIKVSLNSYSHTRPQDVNVLVVSPNGKGYVVMANAGGATPAVNVNLTFDATASSGVASPVVSGTFQPTVNATPTFVYPALPRPYAGGNMNNALAGFSPNGSWSLYVVDNVGGEAGTIAGGWSLDITTVPYVPPPIGCAAASLTSPAFFPTGTGPAGMVAGDFNGDTKPDLATANQSSNDVSILLNDGNGGFGAPTSFTAGTNPYSLAAGDFNNDLKTDLVVVNSGSNNFSLLLGNGMGSFGAPTHFAAGSNPIWASAGDFNTDGKLDLAVANFGGFFAGTVSVLLGNGMGGFGPPAAFSARTQPSYVAIADLNGDTKLDLAVANFGSDNVTILLGTGTGSFVFSNNVLAGNLTSGFGPVSLAVADFTGDSKLDLAIAHYNNNSYTIRPGIGNGTFGSSSIITAGVNPISITSTDLDSNGIPDVAVANYGESALTLSVTGTATAGSSPSAVVSADFNGDGRIDLATANAVSNDVAVILNQCVRAHGNTFDFGGDRRTDLGVYRPSTGFWYTLTRFGGSLNSPFGFGHPNDRPVPADYDGDNRTDFAVFRPSTGAWTVTSSTIGSRTYNLQFGAPTDIPVPADYDGDRRADIAVFRPSDGNWFIRQSTDNALRVANFGTSGDLPVPADFDGDEKADLVVFRPSNGTWYLMNSGGGMLGVAFGATGDRPVADDYDGDGKADIAVFRDGIWYYLQSSDGTFKGYSFGIAGDRPVPGDYDSDGRFDIAVYRPSTGFWYAILSTTNTVIGQPFGLSTDIATPATDVP